MKTSDYLFVARFGTRRLWLGVTMNTMDEMLRPTSMDSIESVKSNVNLIHPTFLHPCCVGVLEKRGLGGGSGDQLWLNVGIYNV